MKDGELKVFYAGGINEDWDKVIEDALSRLGFRRWASGQEIGSGVRDLAFQLKLNENGESLVPVHWQSQSRIWGCFSELAREILVGGAYKVTKFLSNALTVKATRKLYEGKILKGHTVDIVFTVGKPNYEEREVIKRRKKEGISLLNHISEKFLK